MEGTIKEKQRELYKGGVRLGLTRRPLALGWVDLRNPALKSVQRLKNGGGGGGGERGERIRGGGGVRRQ